MDRDIFSSLCTGVQFKRRPAAPSSTPAARGAPAALQPTPAEPATNDPAEADNVLRKRRRIRVAGGSVPPPLRSLQQLQSQPGCPAGLQATLAGMGCRVPTPIQCQAIPVLLAGREVLAVAPTGSGKTLAYLLPLLLALCGQDPGPGPRAAIMAPTKELAAQIARVLDVLLPGSGLRGSLLTSSTAAGTDFTKVDILAGTPLLAGKLIKSARLQLGNTRFLVLDEGDRLLDDQFIEQVDAVLAACTSPHLVRALFSASLSETIEDLAHTIMHNPARVTVGERGTAVASVHQRLQFVGTDSGKLLALQEALAKGLQPPVLVFVSSKDRALALHRELVLNDIPADSITADQGQAARRKAMEKFRSGKTWLLITTDLLARGIDFVLDTVISYDFPHSSIDYVHRVGRTGRAGRTGHAVTFFTEDDMPRVKKIANIIVSAGGDVPHYISGFKEAIRPQPKAKQPGSKTSTDKKRRRAA